VSQGVGPEFKSQHRKKKEKEKGMTGDTFRQEK
jgi:hypothetical protein